MPPKTTPSGKKKSSGSSSASSDAKPKFKLPKSFIVRPLNSVEDKDAAYIEVSNEVMENLELKSNGLCVVSKEGENGIVAICRQSTDEIPVPNVMKVSKNLRSVGNILLGDRLELRKLASQPEYIKNITIGNLQGLELPVEALKVVERSLDKCGLLMPGMVFSSFEIGNDVLVDIIVVDIDKPTDELPDVSKLSISENIEKDSVYTNMEYLSPPGIFKKGTSQMVLSNDTEANSRHNLPRPILYNAIGGLTKEISTLKSTVELPLHRPQLFTDFGIEPPRGILLHGPPGTGKTMLLRCVANETNAHVLTINGPSIVSKYLGETEAALRDIFNEAKRFQPSIIFIDEIDSLAPNRASDDSGEVESRVVATLLTLMDGMDGSGRLAVVAATNRPNSIDPALRRPGRLDQEIEISIPDVEARHDILKKQFARMSTKRQVLSADDIYTVASKTHGYVGADLIALCRESVMKTIQRGEVHKIDINDLKVGIQDVLDAMVDVRPSAMREIFLEMPKVYWNDIGGQEELKRKMKEMIQLPLEASETFAKLGVNAPKGVLLYGPPGCSKTLTAKALATESGINFLAVKGPEIFNKYVGESERAIREIFRKARAASPSIIFFDEIDALSPDRDSGSGTSAGNHVLTSLLNEIDGVEELKGVVIVAATNRPDEIDAALLRPGRLDRHIYVGPPDYNARLQILRKCTAKFNLNQESVDLEALAECTEGCSGAEVVLLCQEAGLAAIMEDMQANEVNERHFLRALKGISRGITPEMLQYYEAFASRSGISA